MKWSIIFILVFNVFFHSLTWSQSVEQLREFADSNHINGRYERALLDYHRLAFFAKDSLGSKLLYKIGDCYLNMGDLRNALDYFNRSAYLSKSRIDNEKALFGKIKTLSKLGEWNMILDELNGENFKDSSTQKRAQFYEGVAHFALENYDSALYHFTLCLDENDSIGRKKMASLFLNQKRLHSPDSKLAGLLSLIIPGSGQFYAGDYKNGFNSLLINTAFIGLFANVAAAYTILDASISVLPWFQRYYLGGISRARKIAYSRRQEKKAALFKETLELLEKN